MEISENEKDILSLLKTIAGIVPEIKDIKSDGLRVGVEVNVMRFKKARAKDAIITICKEVIEKVSLL